MISISHYCRGYSHLESGKPCQDFAYAESTAGLTMAIVSDGHGGERYFRSNVGSSLVVEIARDAIRDFVALISQSPFVIPGCRSVFEAAPFTAYGPDEPDRSGAEGQRKNVHKALQWLFASIIGQWNKAIARHAAEHDISDWEENHIDNSWLLDFRTKRKQGDATFEVTYGCTLMAYVQTPDYWFAFHLGDGKCVMMDEVDGKLAFTQPIPWDERCFLNKTTSMCDCNAMGEFRYCYQGDGHFPLAVCLGSDGVDDSFGDGELLYNFYVELMKITTKKDGSKAAMKALRRDLPLISQRGSKDDMSVACVYQQMDSLHFKRLLYGWQKDRTEEAFNATEGQVMTLQQKVESLEAKERTGELTKHEQINLGYARKDLERNCQEAKQLKKRLTAYKGEHTKLTKASGKKE